jgi:hypothetical protein
MGCMITEEIEKIKDIQHYGIRNSSHPGTANAERNSIPTATRQINSIFPASAFFHMQFTVNPRPYLLSFGASV